MRQMTPMEIKNIFDPSVKQEIISRIHKLTPASQAAWGKMNVSQMLAHVGMPVGVALGLRTVKGNWFMRLVLPLFKSTLYNGTPYKQGLPTDKSYVMTGQEKDFAREKTELLGLLDRFTEANIIDRPHPVFGKLTKDQWSRATWKHLDHHLRQFGV